MRGAARRAGETVSSAANMREYQNFIGGEWVPARDGRLWLTSNPGDTRETVAQYALGGKAEAEAAVESASRAFPGWRATTSVARGRILSKASQILEGRKAELSELLTREEGKTLAESQGETQRAIDIFRFFGGLSYVTGGQTIPHDMPGNLLYTVRQPLGVVALITPWNFPVAIPAWKMAPALLAGNTVVLKPASQTPSLSLELAKALQEAGLPKGVLNVVVGEGRGVGGELATNPAVVALSFTGSYSVGHAIYAQLAPRMARAQMEMGGKNPTIVLADADLDLAASLTARAAFGLTGQACTATSRVIVDNSVILPFMEKLVAKARAIKVGPGWQPGVDIGPAVNRQELEGNFQHIEGALAQGARLAFGGHRLTEGDLQYGHFMEPTILDGVTPDMRIAREEVFGPVLAVMQAGGLDDALSLANGLDVGLSATVVTRDIKKAMQFTERIEAGVVKVNQISTGLALQAPFGGIKKSSTDSFREQGAGAIEFYSKLKTVYLDYSA
jgi:aldehyde dehydrogenase (NAD+)